MLHKLLIYLGEFFANMVCLYLQFFLTVFLLVLPGILLINIFYPQLECHARYLSGTITGLGLSIYLSFLLSYFSLNLFWPVYLAIFIYLLFHLLKTKKKIVLFNSISKESLILIFLLLLVLASRMISTWSHSLPLGWDPSFHLILARKIFEANQMIFDWKPFEQISLNYPVGSHILLVLISKLAKLELHHSFSFLFPLLGSITTLQVYIFTKQICKSLSMPIYAAIAYGLWALYGSIGYVEWGGLPNLLAMSFFMQCLIILTANRYKLIDLWLFTLSFTVIIFTHHHVSLTAGFIMLVILISFVVVRDYQRLRFLASGLVLSGLLGSFYIFPYAKKVLTIGGTGVLKYHEVFFDLELIIISLGSVFFFTAVIGLLLLVFIKELPKLDLVFYAVLFSLIFLFIFFEYLYRFYAIRVWGENFVAFTPSRFLTNLSYFACILSAVFFVWVESTLNSQKARSYLIAFCLLLSLANLPTWKKIINSPTPSSGYLAAMSWVDQNLAEDILVLNKDSWGSYLSWRKNAYTPIPVSEPFRIKSKLNDLEYSSSVLVSNQESHDFDYKVLWKDRNSSWEVRKILE